MEINSQKMKRMQKLMQIFHGNYVNKDKIDLLKSLLSVAMSPVPIGISGAFYIWVKLHKSQ